jgi:3'-5' exoribonuclease
MEPSPLIPSSPPAAGNANAGNAGAGSGGGVAGRPRMNLRDLAPNAFVDGIYSILNPQMGSTRGGKPFLKCLLRDATAEIAARQWTFDETAFDDISRTGFVWVAGHTQLYNQQVQLVIEQIKGVEVTAEDITALLPTTSKDINQMWTQLCAIMRSLQHPAMRALADAYLNDEEMMAKFRLAPAAMSLHHAWIGGLLEHTLQLLKLAEQMLSLYPQLNRDIVLMGLFLHDLGKTAELTWERGFDYTTDGNLIGHIVRGAIWLQFKAAVAAKQSGNKLPLDALRVLMHIVISHHSQPEFGAAKYPATPEAIFVAQLDNLDAKTQMSLSAARPEIPAAIDQGDFTDKIWALDTKIYKPDPLKGT